MVDIGIFYFSASGVTAHTALMIAGLLGGDIYEIVPKERYSKEDLDWRNPDSRSSLEMKDLNSRPEFTCGVENMDKYNTVFVGFPIWWYEAPRIIQSFLESYDFAGKTVIPFATSGGSDMGNTDAIIQRSAPTATWKLGKRLASDMPASAINEWLEELGF